MNWQVLQEENSGGHAGISDSPAMPACRNEFKRRVDGWKAETRQFEERGATGWILLDSNPTLDWFYLTTNPALKESRNTPPPPQPESLPIVVSAKRRPCRQERVEWLVLLGRIQPEAQRSSDHRPALYTREGTRITTVPAVRNTLAPKSTVARSRLACGLTGNCGPCWIAFRISVQGRSGFQEK